TAATHGNPTADPLQLYGDTPTGEYLYIGITEPATSDDDIHKYGPYGAIKMEPLKGDAATARNNGRTGIMIHGGAVDPANGLLRRTNGCIRLFNEDIQYLKGLIDQLNSGSDQVVNVIITDDGEQQGNCADNSSCDETEPPF